MRAVLFTLFCAVSLAHAGDGDVDPSFGNNGNFVQAPSDASPSGYSVAIQSDGKILIGGTRWTFNAASEQNQAAIWRLLPDGAPDPTFGVGGLVTVPFASGLPLIFAMAPQADGSVLAAGDVGGFGVMRLRADGGLDPDFGAQGIATVDFSDLGVASIAALGIAIDAQARILLVGGGHITSSTNWGAAAIARLSASGTLDTSFGTGGRSTLVLGNAVAPIYASFRSVASDAAGRIWVAGSGQPGSTTGFLAARFDATGALDSGFGTNGVVMAGLPGSTNSQSSAGALRGGRWLIGGACDAATASASLCMLALREDGSPDSSFGNQGWASMPAVGIWPRSNMACQADGKCLVLATAVDPTASQREYAVARFDAAGVADPSFGNAGLARVAVPTNGDGGHVIARAIGLQSGRPVLVGTTDGVPYVNALFATRLEADLVFADGFE